MKNKIKIFGILNITPDSFSDGGNFLDSEKALIQVEKLFLNGADFIDVGGESTRPNAETLDIKEEWGRVREILKVLVKKFPEKISLDSRNWQTAENFCKLGGKILNDVSGFQDKKMIEVAFKYQTLCIVNHFPGKSITEVHEQKISSIKKVKKDLLDKVQEMMDMGILKENIILDPGIGFGKTMHLNKKLLKFAEEVPDFKVMIGHSKKRFLGEKRLEKKVNIEAGEIAQKSGAWCLRVHDARWY